MNSKSATVILLAFLFAGFVSGYSGTSETINGVVPTTACNNDIDDDNDGYTDSNDPGCAEPYYADDSEANIYDLDASWVFSGNSTPTSSGPSAFYGWSVESTGDEVEGDFLIDSNTINESYIENSASTWGGGVDTGTDISISNGGTTSSVNSGFEELIDLPGTGTGQTCGDGRRNEGSEENFDCPEDYGLPDDFSESNGGTVDESNQHVSETFSNNLGSNDLWNANNIVSIGDNNNDASNGDYLNSKNNNDVTSDRVWYSFSSLAEGMIAPEAEGTRIDDITGSETDDQVVQDGQWTNVPDFYLKDGDSNGEPDEIWMVYPQKVDEEPIGSDNTVTDYDIEDESNYATISDEKGGSVSASGSCTQKSGTTGWKCSGTDTKTVCTDTETRYYDEATLNEESTEVSVSSTESLQASSSGEFGWQPDIQTQSNGLSVEVTYDDKELTERSYTAAYNCGTYDDDSCGANCTLTGGASGHQQTSFNYPDDHTSDNINYYFEELDLQTTKVFDLNPSEDVSSNNLPGGKEILFEGDSFKSEDYSNSVIRNSVSGEAWWSYEKTKDNKDQGNDKTVSASNFHLEIVGDKFFSRRTEYRRFDADGPNGQGDGFVAINGGSIVGSTNQFLSRELRDGSVVDNFVSQSDVPVPSCPGDSTKCVASIDVSLNNLNNWANTHPNTGLSFHTTSDGPYKLDASLGTCMMYKDLTGDAQVNCRHDSTGGGSGSSGGSGSGPSPAPIGACGDQPDEYWAYMEGPEVNESVLDDNPSHFEGCIDTSMNEITRSACILNGTSVPEGHVANVADTVFGDQYEAGGNSPDMEVCLDLEDTGIDTRSSLEGDDRSGDNVDNDISQTDNGGEWYDLDSEAALEYLRGVRDGTYSTTSGRNLVSDSSDVDSNDLNGHNTNDIDWYWRENPNPFDSDYNPEGNSFGTAIEDDCGNSRFDSLKCNDPGSVNHREATFYSFFNAGKRDDDFQAQGINSSGESYFNGYINKLEDSSNQLESGMDTDSFYTADTPNPSIWDNSDGSESAADQWAITKFMNWSISSRGVPYPPYGVYHRNGEGRTSPQQPTVTKTEMVFGNSYAAVDSSNNGVWIDPDDIKSDFSSYEWTVPSWKNVYSNNYSIDITGPDAGLGVDKGDTSSLEFYTTPSGDTGVVYGDIYFEDEPSTSDATTSNTDESLEPPVCGDDQKEFLLEERGEVVNSEKYEGRYACSDRRDKCVQRDYGTQKMYDPGTYLQANEAAEDRGRLKNDEEYCAELTNERFSSYNGDDFPNWYDQDFGDVDGDGVQDTCTTNNLYGALGKRWFSKADVEATPHAFTGGIDDDSNPKLENENLARYDSYPEQDEYNNPDSETPVSSGELDGTPDRNVVTKGFCGGDDESEYIVTQRCNTRFCETDNSVIGVARDPDHCILSDDVEDVSLSGDKQRDLFEQGDTVEVNTGSDSKTIACYGGEWNEEWPVVFLRDETTVPLGTTDRVSFQVINILEDEKTFDLELSIGDSDLNALTTFTETGTNEMTVSVPGSSSETYSVEIRGNRVIESEEDIELQAETNDGSLEGFDTLQASITNSTTSNAVGNTTQQTRDVPGISMLQVAWLVMMASTIYFFTGRKI